MEEYTEVFVWGTDSFGQMGLGSKTSGKVYKIPKSCSFNILIQEISCGEEHSAFISQSGFVYTMGSNTEGRLGIGTKAIKQSHSPCLVEHLASYKSIKVSCGWGHTVVITELGEAYAWGIGESGALGNGSSESQWAPKLMAVRGNAIAVSCGSRHTGLIVLDKNNNKTLFMSGAGEAGQLGIGRRDRELTPVQIEVNEDVKQVACGVYHTGFLTFTGKVYMTGGNSYGQLGLGNRKSVCRPEKVQMLDGIYIEKLCCSNFTAALSEKGQIFVWGSGIFGEFLLPYKVNSASAFKFLEIGTGFGVGIDVNGNLLSFGSNSEGELGFEDSEGRLTPVIIPSLKGKNIQQAACGGKFCIALGADVFLKKLQDSYRKPTQNAQRVKKSPSPIPPSNLKAYEEHRNEHNRSVDNIKSSKHRSNNMIASISKEIKKFRVEIDKSMADKNLLETENNELVKTVEELRGLNFELNEKVLMNKEQLNSAKNDLEECRRQMKNREERFEFEINSVKEQLNQEIYRRGKLETDMQSMNYQSVIYEGNIEKYQSQINDLHDEIQGSLKRWESDKAKMQEELEKSYKEIKELNKKNESLMIAKELVKDKFDEKIDQEVKRYLEEILGYQGSIEKMKKEIELLKNDNRVKVTENELEKANFIGKIRSLEEMIASSQLADIQRIKLVSENEEMKSENLAIKNQNELLKGEINELKGEINAKNRKNSELNGEINELRSDINIKNLKNSELNREINDLKSQIYANTLKNSELITSFETEKSSYLSEISKLGQSLIAKDAFSKQDLENLSKINKDQAKIIESLKSDHEISKKSRDSLDQDLKTLKSSYEKVLLENNRYSSKIQSLASELELLAQTHDEANTDKETLIFKLSTELAACQQEKSNLLGHLDEKANEIDKIKSNLSGLVQENLFLKSSVDELKHEIEKAHNNSKEHQLAYSQLKENKAELAMKYDRVLIENKQLKLKVSELEGKNQEIFQNLEKDLAQKAKDFKERTINLLSIQKSNSGLFLSKASIDGSFDRSRSPFARPDTPLRELNIRETGEYDKNNCNAVARLFGAFDKSPNQKTSEIRSTTPTKENIKARIASLMESRNKLEAEMSRGEQ